MWIAATMLNVTPVLAENILLDSPTVVTERQVLLCGF